MKKYAFLVVAILALVVFASGCITVGNQISNQSAIPTKTYSANGISFNYPANWQQLENISTLKAIATFGDLKSANASTRNESTLVVIQKVALPSNTTLKQVYDAAYTQYAAQNPSFQQISDKKVIVDNTTAYENIHKINVSGVQRQERAVWLEKNGNIYVILAGTLPSNFDNQQANFDVIINSFKVQ